MTLYEILIVMTILAILAAVLYPSVGMQLRRGQSTAIANQFESLRDAIDNFRSNVLRYPSSLTELTTTPPAFPAVYNDLCAVNIPAANRALWRGPYLNRNVTGNFPVGDGTVQTALVRNPAANPPVVSNLEIDILNVDSTAAVDLERQYDGNSNFATGTFQWAQTGVNIGDATFVIPIRGC